MTKSRNFKSLSLAHSWLESRGFAKTGAEHVWVRKGQMAYVGLILGGYRPAVQVSVIEDATASMKLAA